MTQAILAAPAEAAAQRPVALIQAENDILWQIARRYKPGGLWGDYDELAYEQVPGTASNDLDRGDFAAKKIREIEELRKRWETL